jgi:hypothetical protein
VCCGEDVTDDGGRPVTAGWRITCSVCPTVTRVSAISLRPIHESSISTPDSSRRVEPGINGAVPMQPTATRVILLPIRVPTPIVPQ